MSIEETSECSSRFGRRELLVLVAVVGLMLAAIVPAIQGAIEAARRTACNGYLKQTGLAVLNFHDARQEICPSYLTDDHSPDALPRGYATWPVLLLPYREQQDVYDLVDLSVPLDETAEPTADHTLIRGMTMLHFQCYSRRSGWNGPFRQRSGWKGPFAVGDYACVSLAEASSGKVVRGEPRTWDAAMLPSRVFNASKDANTTPLGDFAPGALRAREFRSMTSFASILDGLSNTAFIGEKAIRRGHLGGHTKDFAKTVLPSEQDGTFYHGRGGDPADLIAPGAMAHWSRRLAPLNPGERLLPLQQRDEDPNNRFGSWHPGITLFLLGDGSVRQVNNATSTLVLQRLGCRNDGERLDLP
jgi:hypothetical protein